MDAAYHKIASAKHYADHRDEVLSRSAAYYQDHKDEIKARTAAYYAERRKTDIRPYMLAAARKRAREKGVPFDLAPEDLIIPEKCPVLGITLVPAKGHHKPNSPSLDRIRPELGYVRGNIAIISYRANTIKNNASFEELSRVTEYVGALEEVCRQ